MSNTVDLPINTSILMQCREQMGLTVQKVQAKVKAIEQIDSGAKSPTYNQLTTLADLYQVPRWVFTRDTLPAQYQYDSLPLFRRVKNAVHRDRSAIMRLIPKVERYRQLILELGQDAGEEVPEFITPQIDDTMSEKSADIVRNWLGLDGALDFDSLKERVERRNIFVFMTSKYKGWSHADKSLFRGLCIYYPTLPIIIINNSDAKKAQSFTLLHELGHLLLKETDINFDVDLRTQSSNRREKWCDSFAGATLMPSHWFDKDVSNLKEIEKHARHLKVSSYAYLVRLRQLQKISQQTYDEYQAQLNQDYEVLQEKLKKSEGDPARDRIKEVRAQFGGIFLRTVFTAYYNKEFDLHKVSQLLELKKASQVLSVGQNL